MKKRRLSLSFNSPAVLGFAALCLAVMALSAITGGRSTLKYFSVYSSGRFSFMSLLRCVTHVLGHADWDHLLGNMMYLLILGPMLEEKYGTADLILVILITALVTGVFSILVFPHTCLMGSSGIVFAFILMSSLTAFKDGEIPVTFILVALLYLGQQVYQGIFTRDNVSQITHILGGATGSVLGFALPKKH